MNQAPQPPLGATPSTAQSHEATLAGISPTPARADDVTLAGDHLVSRISQALPTASGTGEDHRDGRVIPAADASNNRAREKEQSPRGAHRDSAGPERELGSGTSIGRYVVLAKLGSGGMGVVYAAYDPELDRKIAVKLLRSSSRSDDATQEAKLRLLREAQALARLSHPHVVAVHDVGEYRGSVYVAMEYVEGQTVNAWRKSSRRGWSEVLDVMRQAGQGLAAAHQSGLLHRDIKPDNVMIATDGRVRVMDFGLARSARLEDSSSAQLHSRIQSSSQSVSEFEPARDHTNQPWSEEQSLVQPTALTEGQALEPPLPTAPVPPHRALLASGLREGQTDAGARSVVGTVRLSVIDVAVTRADSLVGTPAYIAPEQWAGAQPSAASDQFAFCVMLWELLFGERPFRGRTPAEIASAVLAGRREFAPSPNRVPAWIRRACERGLCVEPALRWSSMNELLVELDRGELRQRRRAIVSASLVVFAMLGTIAGARALDQRWRVDACRAEAASIHTSWDQTRRDSTAAAILDTGSPIASATTQRLFPRIDDHVRAWEDAKYEACAAARIDARWSHTMSDKAGWCLDGSKLALDSLIEELATPDTASLAGAIQSVVSLPTPGACVDEAALLTTPAPPPFALRAPAQELRQEILGAMTVLTLGDVEQADKLSASLASRAATLGYEPLVAGAHFMRGLVLESQAKESDAERELELAHFGALAGSDWAMAARAATRLAHLVGYTANRPVEGERWAEHSRAIQLHAGDPLDLAAIERLSARGAILTRRNDIAGAQLLYLEAIALGEASLGAEHPSLVASYDNVGQGAVRLGDYPTAKTYLDKALMLQVAAYGDLHPGAAGILSNRAVLELESGNYDGALDDLARALALNESVLGPNHPNVAIVLEILGSTLHATGKAAEGKLALERALAINEVSYGPTHPNLSLTIANLAAITAELGDLDGARALFDRAIAIIEKQEEPDLTDLSSLHGNIAALCLMSDDLDAAEHHATRALEIRDAWLGPDHPLVATSLIHAASVLNRRESYQKAAALLERAVAILDKAPTAKDPNRVFATQGLAEVHLGLGDAGAALPYAEQAVALSDAGEMSPSRSAESRLILAKALWAAPAGLGRERVRARQVAQRALDDLAAAEGGSKRAQVVRAWLAEHTL